jgi:hypothetical protein
MHIWQNIGSCLGPLLSWRSLSLQRDAPHVQQLKTGQRNRETDTGGMARFTEVPLPCAGLVAIYVPGCSLAPATASSRDFSCAPVTVLKNVAHICTNGVETELVNARQNAHPIAGPAPASLQCSTGMSIACRKLRIKTANKRAIHGNHARSDANEFAVVTEPLAGAAGRRASTHSWKTRRPGSQRSRRPGRRAREATWKIAGAYCLIARHSAALLISSDVMVATGGTLIVAMHRGAV